MLQSKYNLCIEHIKVSFQYFTIGLNQILVYKCVYLARKFYKIYSQNIIKLAVFAQRAWKRYYKKAQKRRKEEKAHYDKLVMIQSFLRGALTRKHMKQNMIQRLTMNDTFFKGMRNKIMEESVSYYKFLQLHRHTLYNEHGSL